MTEAPTLIRTATARQKEIAQTVMLVVTEKCNLNCAYCYEKEKAQRIMPVEMIQEIISRHMTEGEFSSVSFDFFGGEAMLEFETIQTVVEWFHAQRWNKKHRFTISTNGTLFTEENKVWLAANRSCLTPMVSFDGTKEAHDLNRSQSYDRVVQHLPFLREYWPQQPVRITANAQAIPHIAAGVRNIHSFGLVAEVAIVLDDVWGSPEELQRSLDEYETQLAELIDYFEANPELLVPVILSRQVQGLLSDHTPEKAFCGAGKYMVCYTPDGSAYPCHRFTPLCSSRPSALPTAKIPSPAESPCPTCPVVAICPTCQGNNWEANANTSLRTTFHCEFFKREAVASAKLALRRIEKHIAQSPAPEAALKELAPQILGIAMLMKANPLPRKHAEVE
jgi:sulfatase maturation enzyme AslB (radical SAM superfamily)